MKQGITMEQYLMRVEAVNLYHVLDDTRQLSVRRGGGMLLRQAILDIKDIPGLKKNCDSWKDISNGASTGLFQFLSDRPEQCRQTVIDFLHSKKYAFFSFVVDFIPWQKDEPKAPDFMTVHEMVIAQNRFRQFQQPTIVCPKINVDTSIQPCAWDNIRPAQKMKMAGAEPQEVRRGKEASVAWVSESVNVRHCYGREQKKDFIRQETDRKCNYNYTRDLLKLSHSPDFPKCSDKVAVLYFDGNSFGSIQQQCNTPKALSRFDNTIKEKRKFFLKQLVDKAAGDSDFYTSNRNQDRDTARAVRLEILLWGGDELMLVVPAWKGMEVLQLFYTMSKDWSFTDDKGKRHPLTHAGGLVFCHHKTPISRVQSLAREITDYIKENHSRSKNLYNYLVLESIDFPTEPYDTFIKKLYGSQIARIWQPSKPLYGDWPARQELFRRLSDEQSLSRRQVYKLAMAAAESMDSFDTQHERFCEIVDTPEQVRREVCRLFPFTENEQRSLPWLHFSELWDYFAPMRKDEVKG